MEVIATNGLSKHYGKTVAVDNISINVKRGEIYGFLGLNGAGKTTLIRVLLGMIKPTRGKATLFGKDLNSDFMEWNDIGYLVETPHSYPNLSVYQNLQVVYKLRNLRDPSAINQIIESLKLTKYRNVLANALSLGNQQRLGLAKALIHRPKLLILDEPINGLDPQGIVEVRELLTSLARNGSTIFISSHILGEISRIATRIGIIHEGKLIKELTSEELTHQINKKLIVQTNDNHKALKHLLNIEFSAVLTDSNEIEIRNQVAIQKPELITKLLTDKGLPPKQIYLFTEDLEKYFLRIIKAHI